MNASRQVLRAGALAARAQRARAANMKMPKRFGGGAAVEYEPGSPDYIVRQYLPEDRHVVMAICGGYFSLYLLSKLFSGGKKKEEAPAAAPASTSSSGVKSMADEGFAEWIAVDGNIEKYFKAVEDMKD
uniref:Uncharacterized protein n=1 Tax=Phaeomonas parva TaxID=124430 RepID=A0A6U4IDD0_9STRA|mmetsp:Transcript_37417/g.116957  ORF Transcript_37417/g.116957 Transcript_37417/m.116957 type:complete len:129 (+) Transcript_37417:39-425(+)